jgi:hypothetical protein
MANQQRFRALRNDRQLARFVLEGRATGKQLGTGSYGSVEEVLKGRKTSREKWCIMIVKFHGNAYLPMQ